MEISKELFQISKIAKEINSKDTSKKVNYGSNKSNDEKRQLEQGYAIARSQMFVYEIA